MEFTHMPKRSDAEKDLPAFDLKAARESKGLTQAAAAVLLCASQASMARWEREGTLPLIYRRYWDIYWQHNKVVKKQKPALKVVRTVKEDVKPE